MIHGFILLTVTCATAGFNIFTKPVNHFKREGENLFGQAIIETQQGVLVTSPNSATESVFHCILGKGCSKVNLSENARKGLKPIVSVAKKLDEHQHMVCQQVRKRKAINEDLNGHCTLLVDLKKTDEISPASLVVEQMKRNNTTNNNNNNNNNNNGEPVILDADQSLLRKRRQTSDNKSNNNNNEDEDDEDAGTEIVFVLDGSGSIDKDDFEIAKDFVSKVMVKIWETCFSCEFAVVQYGMTIRTELLLLENDNVTKALEKVKNIQQIYHYTKTASAINHVLEHVFVAENGSKENSKKMLIVMTDGDIFFDPMNLTVVLSSPKMENILRFAIGVGNALTKDKGIKELKEIASDPDDKHLFMVNNYAALAGILSNLEKTITAIEGIQQGAGFLFELAEAGFSSHFAHDGNLMFGAVGAYDWSGGLILKHPKDGHVTFLNDSSTAPRFSYLGYSVVSALGFTDSLYVSGAPRYNLSGSVHVFNNKSLRLTQMLLGDQVGSYFGSELCVLDFDKDGKTDYLMVGAPYFHIKGEEGKVYVYRLNQAQGQFDEEATEWRGADGYVFAMFGSAIVSIGDIDRNGFNDVAVGAPLEEDASGSSGSIYIFNGYKEGIRQHFSQRISPTDLEEKLRYFGRSISRMPDPQKNREHIIVGSEGAVTVLQALPVIVFNPRMTMDPPNLPSAETGANLNNIPVTLKICFNTVKKIKGNWGERQLPISYEVNLDAAQETKRLYFGTSASWRATFDLTQEKECLETIHLKFTSCSDCFSPIKIQLSFSLPFNYSAGPPLYVLDKFSPTELTTELPFRRDCVKCEAKVSLSESKLSMDTIVIGRTQDLSISFNLTNRGDGSYMTTLVLTYPRILLFNKLSKPSDTLIICANEERHTNSQLKCNIMYPVLKRDAQVSFSISWQVVAQQTPKTNPQFLTMKSGGETEKQTLTFEFEIYGENKYNATVNISITVQARHTELQIKEIPKDKCRHVLQGRAKTSHEPHLIQCDVREMPDTIVIKADASIKAVEDMIKANVTVYFDGEQYDTTQRGHSELVEVPIIKPEIVKSTSTIIGGSIGGFLLLAAIIAGLIKCGFFRSRYSVEKPEDSN
ncbi:hypothetical protein AAFF_G00347040 [Aldrovandia affinis]|uniref:VWFA domain-containing protein n=1 Tax=Aldrovandia affinis TaxID=143900 RepID=A0AAD7SLU8_9TELE|nr:hypothetical protein AAFF_G00347040 [Aldrovandia affinis]